MGRKHKVRRKKKKIIKTLEWYWYYILPSIANIIIGLIYFYFFHDKQIHDYDFFLNDIDYNAKSFFFTLWYITKSIWDLITLKESFISLDYDILRKRSILINLIKKSNNDEYKELVMSIHKPISIEDGENQIKMMEVAIDVLIALLK